MKVIVKITDGIHTYTEDVTEDQKESFEECSTNGANPWLNNFKRYTRSLIEFELKTKLIEQYNTTDKNAHFIFGWCECFFQSDNAPNWMYESEECLKIEVKNITTQGPELTSKAFDSKG